MIGGQAKLADSAGDAEPAIMLHRARIVRAAPRVRWHAVIGVEDDGLDAVAIEKQRQQHADGAAADDQYLRSANVVFSPHSPSRAANCCPRILDPEQDEGHVPGRPRRPLASGNPREPLEAPTEDNFRPLPGCWQVVYLWLSFRRKRHLRG